RRSPSSHTHLPPSHAYHRPAHRTPTACGAHHTRRQSRRGDVHTLNPSAPTSAPAPPESSCAGADAPTRAALPEAPRPSPAPPPNYPACRPGPTPILIVFMAATTVTGSLPCCPSNTSPFAAPVAI